MSEDAKRDAMEKGQTEAPAKKKRKNRRVIVIGVVAAVAVLGVGFAVWHEQPTFCNAICHNMDAVVDTYYETPDATSTDKWGNEVSNASATEAVVHAQAGLNCLSCHKPSLAQQMHEASMYVTNAYEDPIPERSLEELLRNAGDQSDPDAFCMNGSCHGDMTREGLTEATADMAFNPHSWEHEEITCSECHKSHRASVLYCTKCHEDSVGSLPDGWVTYSESVALENAAFEKDGKLA